MAGSSQVCRNGSRGKPLKMRVNCPGRPMPAARYWRVMARVQRTDEMRCDREDAGSVPEGAFHGTFRSAGWAGNQLDLEPGLLAEAQNGGHGVFLRPTQDEPGDDVRDAHGRGSEAAGL